MLLKAVGVVTLAGGAVLTSMSYVVVDVREAGPKGMHIVVPVPLIAAEAALAFAPDHALQVDVDPEAKRFLPVAREMAAELRAMPDAELVRVQDGNEDVRIAKVGDRLEVRITTPKEKVFVNVPLDAVEEVLASIHGDTLNTRALLGALRSVRNTDLVDVQTADGERVRVWVW